VIPLRHAATPTGEVPQVAMLGGGVGKIVRFVGRAVTGLAGDAVYAAAKLWEDHYRAARGFHSISPHDVTEEAMRLRLTPSSRSSGSATLAARAHRSTSITHSLLTACDSLVGIFHDARYTVHDERFSHHFQVDIPSSSGNNSGQILGRCRGRYSALRNVEGLR